MNTLYMAWQSPRSRRWFPVGRLLRHETEPAEYEFVYLRGAEQAREEEGFFMAPGFWQFGHVDRAPVMFPTFRNRIMNPSRPDRPEYLAMLGMHTDNWDAVTELSLSGGRQHSDDFEVFPEIVPDESGRFATQFIVHGLRHTNAPSIERSEELEEGDPLEVSFELNNPAAKHAISVKTIDQYVLGWLPRYLVDGMHRDNAWMVDDVEATVAQVNGDAPLSHRLLVDFKGRLPKGFSPMRDLPQYQPIVSAEATPAPAP